MREPIPGVTLRNAHAETAHAHDALIAGDHGRALQHVRSAIARLRNAESAIEASAPAVADELDAETTTSIWHDLLDTWGTSASGRRTMSPATARGITRHVINALNGRGLLATARTDTTKETP